MICCHAILSSRKKRFPRKLKRNSIQQSCPGKRQRGTDYKEQRIIQKRTWRVAVVLPTFYRILDGLNEKDYLDLDEKDFLTSSFKADVVWLTNLNPLTGQAISKTRLNRIFRASPQTLFLINEAAMLPLVD